MHVFYWKFLLASFSIKFVFCTMQLRKKEIFNNQELMQTLLSKEHYYVHNYYYCLKLWAIQYNITRTYQPWKFLWLLYLKFKFLSLWNCYLNFYLIKFSKICFWFVNLTGPPTCALILFLRSRNSSPQHLLFAIFNQSWG